MSYYQNGQYLSNAAQQRQQQAQQLHPSYATQRPHSYYVGDDSSFPSEGTSTAGYEQQQQQQQQQQQSHRPSGLERHTSVAQRQNQELFMGEVTSPVSPPLSSPTAPGYGRQYPQPPAASSIPTYNPQQYATPIQLPNPATYGGVNRTFTLSSAPQVYNPADYAESNLARTSTVSRPYNLSPTNSYNSSSAHTTPSQQNYPSPPLPQQQQFPPAGTYPSQDSRYAYSQSQTRPSAYTPPAPPPPPVPPTSGGMPGEDWGNLPVRQPSAHSNHSYQRSSDASYLNHPLPSPPAANNHGSLRSRSSRHGSQGDSQMSLQYNLNAPLPPTPPAPPHGSPQRRNTVGRPLPPPPQDDESPEAYPGQNGVGYFDQEDLFDEIENAVLNAGNNRTTSPRIVEPANGNHSYQSSIDRSGSGRAAGVTNGHLSPNVHADQYYSDESDVEAAAGLAALQAAEAQEQAEEARRRSGGSGLFSNYASLQPPQPTYTSGGAADQGSDSDYVGVDMSTFAGTYDPHFSYGGTQPADLTVSGASTLVGSDNHSRTLSSSNSLRRSEASDNESYDYGLGNLHPFPQYSAGATVDAYGTGGLADPTAALRRRLSYDEGDEQNFVPAPVAAGEQPDMYYYSGMARGRPLPPPPVDTRIQPADWRYGSAASPRQTYTPEAYSGVTPVVPRSTSMLSHSHTPQTQPPARSKTDAEQTAKLRQPGRASTFYGSENPTPPEATPLDLPTIPAGKRFNPVKLTERDFDRCTEPWALSSIISWLKYMAEGESDLKENLITEGLVALFTFKVPTMNIADAETISARVVQDMYKAGTLIHDEEWLKFSSETMTGVIFQLTGSGCYSQRLHEYPTPGRCYSQLCQRTVKKIDLTAQPALEQKDWASTYNLKKEDIEGVDKHEVERQNILHEILTGEEKYMSDLDVLRHLYRDRLLTAQPPIIPPKTAKSFVNKVFGCVDSVKKANEEHLLPQLKYRQKEQGPWITGFSAIFREWIRKAKQAYLDYCSNFPYAEYLVRQEESRNMIFRSFLDQARADKRSNKLNWDSFLKAPIARLQRYILLLNTVLKNSKVDNDEKRNLQLAIEEIVAVTQECNNRVGQVQHKVEISELQTKLIMRPGMPSVELNLDHLGRELIHRGDLIRLGGNRFTLLDTHALLFDHYLVLAKTITHRDSEGGIKAEKYDISKLPITMQLLVLESTDDDPVTKSSVKGITTVAGTPKASTPSSQLGRTTSSQSPVPGALSHTNTSSSLNSLATTSSRATLTSTLSADSKDDKIMYPFRIKHLGKEVFTLFAPSLQARSEWCQKIMEAKTKHASSLFAQHAEPFRLRVMADTAFAYETGSAVQKAMVVKGTPLDRAIDEVEKLYQHQGRPAPICRSRVNCATAFMQPYGKNMVAVGTDNAVYIAEVDNPRGWSRAIQVPRVTQIAVLEEFSLLLLISDKSLIAYHLDAVCPVGGVQPASDSVRRAPQKLSGARDIGFFATGRMKDRALVFYKKREGLSSTFKVLEPVFQKSTEKKSRMFKSGRTEFFREFDEFYIPTECSGINLFHSSLAVSTSKGFEVLTLDKKQPWSVPDLKAPHVASIAARIQAQTQATLGMFRLSDQEFLLVYSDCAVYVNKHGDISRSVIMEFVGHAKSAALYNKYLILFDSDFVEIRNAMNGRLRQVISGRDVRCLDDGLGGGTEGYRSVKVGMGHPERVGVQVVVEMVLDEGAKE